MKQEKTSAEETREKGRRVSRHLPADPAGQATKNSRQRTTGLPGADPGLPPTAQRLLAAARRLLARSGYNSLSVEAIGREAGENKALIRYYFGSKDGLLVALVDELVSEAIWQARQRLSALPAQQEGADLVVEVARTLPTDTDAYRLFFDLLPRLLEKPIMARKLADLYRIHRELNIQALWAGRATEAPDVVQDLAALTVALTDGLAVQLLAEPGCVDVAQVMAT